MRYHQRRALLAFLLLVTGGGAVLRAQDDTWQVTDAGGTIITPVRSLGLSRDSIVTILVTTRVTQWGDSAVVHRFYEPRRVPIDGLRELRDARPEQILQGAVMGVGAGLLLGGIEYFSKGESADPVMIVVPVLAGPVIGSIAGGIAGIDEVYDLDPLSPEERRVLIAGKIPRASPDELGIRTIDSTLVVGEMELERARKGKQWRQWDITLGTGPGTWSRSQGGRSILASRLSLAMESSGILFTGGVTVSSTRWSSRAVYECLLGTQFVWDDFRVSASGGAGFVVAELLPLSDRKLPAGLDPSIEHGSAIGLSLASEATFLVGDSWGLSATGYSSISRKGTMLGLALSAKFGSLR